jgi:hypothetical protein
MNTAVSTKTLLATLAAPLLALAVGLAGTASAEEAPGGAVDTITQLREAGHPVVIHKTGDAPMPDCSVIDIQHERHEHHGGPESDAYNTVFVDVMCPMAAGQAPSVAGEG